MRVKAILLQVQYQLYTVGTWCGNMSHSVLGTSSYNTATTLEGLGATMQELFLADCLSGGKEKDEDVHSVEVSAENTAKQYAAVGGREGRLVAHELLNKTW